MGKVKTEILILNLFAIRRNNLTNFYYYFWLCEGYAHNKYSSFSIEKKLNKTTKP